MLGENTELVVGGVFAQILRNSLYCFNLIYIVPFQVRRRDVQGVTLSEPRNSLQTIRSSHLIAEQ